MNIERLTDSIFKIFESQKFRPALTIEQIQVKKQGKIIDMWWVYSREFPFILNLKTGARETLEGKHPDLFISFKNYLTLLENEDCIIVH